MFYLRALLLLPFLCQAAFSVYAITPDEIKANMLAAMDKINNYSLVEKGDSISYPKGENEEDYPSRVSNTVMEIDFVNKAMHAKSVSQIPQGDGSASMENEVYLTGDMTYQFVGGQWFKMPAGKADLMIFESIDEDKKIVTDGRISIINESPVKILLVPDKEKFLESFKEQFKMFSMAQGGEREITLNHVSIEYWLDDNFNVVKKDVSVELEMKLSEVSAQVIKYHTRSEYTGYNQPLVIVLSQEALKAQALSGNLPESR